MNLARTRWQDWSLGWKGAAVVALPLTLLLAALYSNYTLQRDISRADDDVQRTLTTRANIQALHTLIAEGASGVRGFLLTGREEFLSPYWNAEQRIPPTLETLHETIQDPLQAARLDAAAQLVATKRASLNKLRREGAQLAPEALQTHLRASKQVLDELRTQITDLGDGEAKLLTERIATAAVARRRESIANVVMAVVGLAGAAVALWMLSSGIIRPLQTAATNAERLASGLPLMPPPVARDEIGQLAERLHRASLLLAERAEQARSASRAKTEFLSRTSHELRTPLNVILGFAQLLESDLRGTPAAASVGQVLGAGRHLLSLIDEMLDIARIESGEIALHPQSVALEPLLQELQALTTPLATQNGVQLQVVGSGTLAVQADRQRLRQVLLNLLTNAIKFNRSGGSVRLSAEREGDRVRIAVTDTGVGIAPEQIERLFSPFERLDAERRGVEGTGLGLAISHQLMKRMHGSIEVRSELGHGSVFHARARQRRARGQHRRRHGSRAGAAIGLHTPSEPHRALCRGQSAQHRVDAGGAEPQTALAAEHRAHRRRRPGPAAQAAPGSAAARPASARHVGGDRTAGAARRAATARHPVCDPERGRAARDRRATARQRRSGLSDQAARSAAFVRRAGSLRVMNDTEILASRILIVDDQPGNLRLLEDLLGREGFGNVLSTTDSTQVVDLYTAFDPDLVLLDLLMPGLDGFAVLERLARCRAPDDFRPVLVLTADATRDAKRRALSLGAKDFLTKPFDTVEAMLRIWNLLETRQLYKRLRQVVPDAAPPANWRGGG
jgi:signal transduction histidine kinase/AmiR/NasT family two-component response regulator